MNYQRFQFLDTTDAAFWRCNSLTSIAIPPTVTSIGHGVFQNCSNLTAVTFLGDAPNAGRSLFDGTTSTIYRKPEAKDWGETWGGRPVKLISEKP
jgi:hypothetical protein